MAISTTTALIIGAAVAVATTAASIYAAQQQQEQQNDFQEKLAERQNEIIRQNYALADESEQVETKAVQRQTSQVTENTVNDQMQNAIDAAQARGTARTAAAESGVQGSSVRALLDDFYRQEARYRQMSSENLRYTHMADTDEIEAIQSQGFGRKQALQPYIPEPVQRPNYLGIALAGAGQVANSYNSIYGKRVTPSGGYDRNSFTD